MVSFFLNDAPLPKDQEIDDSLKRKRDEDDQEESETEGGRAVKRRLENLAMVEKNGEDNNNTVVVGAETLRECLNQYRLAKVKAKGLHFTWSNRRGENEITWERLDRAFANPKWFELNENVVLENLPINVSDHSPLLLCLEKSKMFNKRPYRFELMWTTHPQCEKVITNAWKINANGYAAFRLMRKIGTTKEKLKLWNREVFGDLAKRKMELEIELAATEQNIENPGNFEKEATLRRDLEVVLEQEHLMWMQKSRANWMKLL
ncbi:Endonuclease/exonuclease/phosphatase [Corchorus olitorius]|uniref:Endonuclease/exonuclease/phosphatase n=1 Tax=Corchorus olitorius TaxID=93759 RepID=A0A1R3JNY6_9ROSI|nr:Endonuclease/exonuclease/phosphatase [Corchorus olitorius]